MRSFIFCLFLLIPSPILRAQSNNGNLSLTDAVALFHSGNADSDPNNLVASFEKLVSTTTGANAWLPSYYLALLNGRLSIKNKSMADSYADKAINWANLSIASNPNDENYCALTMARITKMAVNPVLRWLRYEKSIYAALNVAKKTNPSNPRIYILEGSLTLNMPSMFWGGCDNAKPILAKARELLEKQTPQKLLPTWGRQHLLDLNKGCPF